jgi:O-antigen/teichoic acid export membrane protein
MRRSNMPVNAPASAAAPAAERRAGSHEIQTAVRHMAAYGIGFILVRVMGFLMIPFYTHYLAPRDYGILEILDLSMTLFGLIVNIGITPALLRSYAAAPSPAEKHKVVSTATIFVMLTGSIVYVIGLACIAPVTMLLFGPKVSSSYVLLSFSALILNYMANAPRTYLRALDKAGTYSTIDTVSAVALLTLNVIFIAILKLGVMGVLLSSVLIAVVQFVLMSVWALRNVGFSFSRIHMARMVRFGAPLVFANVGLFVLNFSDRFFLQHLRSLDIVGIYALGYKFGYMLNALVVQPFFVMWQSRMYSVHAQPDHARIFKQIFALYSLGLIYAGLAMSLFSPEVVGLMVEQRFMSAQTVIPLVVLSYVFYGLSYYAQLGMYLMDQTKAIGVIGIVAAVLNVILNWVLISSFGMIGAAVATLLSFGFLAVASYWRSQMVFRLRLGVGRMFAGMALAVAMYLVCQWRLPAGPVSTIVLKVTLLAAYPVLVWKAGILHPSAAEAMLSGKDQAKVYAARLFDAMRERIAVGG